MKAKTLLTEEEFEKAFKEALDRIPATELIAFALLVILGMGMGGPVKRIEPVEEPRG